MAHKALKQTDGACTVDVRFAGVCASAGRPQGCMHGCHLKCRVPSAWRAARADLQRSARASPRVHVEGNYWTRANARDACSATLRVRKTDAVAPCWCAHLNVTRGRGRRYGCEATACATVCQPTVLPPCLPPVVSSACSALARRRYAAT